MFTANGLYCPIQIIDVKGNTYIINRELAKLAQQANGNGNGSVNGNGHHA